MDVPEIKQTVKAVAYQEMEDDYMALMDENNDYQELKVSKQSLCTALNCEETALSETIELQLPLHLEVVIKDSEVKDIVKLMS